MSDVFFDITLAINENCPAHGWMECLMDREVIETPLTAAGSTLDELLGAIREHVGEKGILSLDDDREIIVGLTCAACEKRRDVLALAGDLSEEEALCEGCGEPMAPDLRSQFDGSEGLGQRTLAEIGLPPLHIVRGRDEASDKEILVELTGDLPLYFEAPGGQ
jgi:hypothetical protein